MSSGHWELNEPPHRCHTPSDMQIRTAGKKVGDVWQCDDCGQRWVVQFIDGGMREPDVHDFYMRKI